MSPRSLAFTALSAFFALGLVADGASAAPRSLPTTALSLDLKDASVGNVFQVLASASKVHVTLDPCVHGTVTLRMMNAPIPLVYDALAAKLGLAYEESDAGIRVVCSGKAEDATRNAVENTRVSVAESDRPLPDVVKDLAKGAKLAGVDYRARTSPAVTLTVKDVRLSTAMTALGDATRLRIRVAGDRLVVSD